MLSGEFGAWGGVRPGILLRRKGDLYIWLNWSIDIPIFPSRGHPLLLITGVYHETTGLVRDSNIRRPIAAPSGIGTAFPI